MRTSRSARRGGLNSRIERAPSGGVSTKANANAPRTRIATRALRARLRLIGIGDDYIQPMRLLFAPKCAIIVARHVQGKTRRAAAGAGANLAWPETGARSPTSTASVRLASP